MNVILLSLILTGPWRFALDPGDAGMPQQWTQSVNLPGTLPGQGIGDDVTLNTKWIGGIADRSFFTAPEYEKYRQSGHIKIPFWLQPDKYYAGPAWYQRDIEIPADWQGKRVVLSLERPHWETRVWVDDTLIGTNNSLSTPHDYDLGLLAPGKHTLTIRVDNRMVIDIGENSHSISDHTQGDWNGIVGRIELRARPPVWIEDVQVYPNVAKSSVRVRVKKGGQPGNAILTVGNKRVEIADVAEVEVPVDAKPWDEFSPNLQELTVRLCDDQRTVRFGLREFAADGTQFAINERKTFLRGTLDCCIYPKTGHPPTDVAEWKRIIGIAKAHGLNLIRFHSWCPPEAAFQAADELGFYFHVEASSWANQSTTLGDGKPVDQWIYEETDRILKYYGNHPSFVLMAYGNEPGGKNHKAYLARYVSHYKALDPRRLWTSGAGWPELPENQWHCVPGPRIQAWGGGLKSRINAKPPETVTDYRDYISRRNVPVVSHEIGQWCVYPNFEEMKKYTGYLKPKNFEIFRDRLAEHGMLDQARDFLLASGKLQTLCYKEDIESALRTPGMAGFELLDLHDFPGQGTALVGVLDPFWEEKGYVTAAEYRRFCNHTVPLARLPKRVFTTDETLEATLEVAHYGPSSVGDIAWKLVGDDGKVVATGQGNVRVELKAIPAPARYKLVANADGFENDWDVWVYPSRVDTQPPSGVRIVDALTDDMTGKVLLLVPPSRVKNAAKDKVVMGFSSIFWNTAWTHRQPPTTLGILCDPQHPVFADFPTDFHSNWQWWYLITQAAPMILDDLPKPFRPIVQVIDDWFTARKLGLLFEANVGKAQVVVCSIALDDSNPVARQFRASLLRYMASDRFAPKQTLERSTIQNLIAPTTVSCAARADSEARGYEAGNAVDGDPNTIWHTPWEGKAPGFPHHLIVEFQKPVTMSGVKLLPRQDMPNGRFKAFEIYVSADGREWGTPVVQGEMAAGASLRLFAFGRKVSGRFLKLVVLSAFENKPYASLAELEILTDEPVSHAVMPREEAVVLTPPPPSSPRINGPKIYGVRPGSPFLYRIPCTGERPMTFAAEGLPEGLALDPSSGIITGRTTKIGTNRVVLTARNAKGEARREFRIVVGDKLALTPPMGWNHWYAHFNRITDEMMRQAADILGDSGMADVGYQYVNVDDCWMNAPRLSKYQTDPRRVGPVRDANGNLLPNACFPDMKALADYIHAKGLKAGLYTSPGETTCAGFGGSLGHEAQDAKQFADWGFDFLKYDWCSYSRVAGKNPDLAAMQKPYRLMGELLRQQKRDIVFNLCQYGMGEVWKWGAEVGGHSWRTGGDLGFELNRIFEVALKNCALRQYNKPGAWNDPDYIQIGWIGAQRGSAFLEPHPCPLTPEEQRSFMSLWCLMAAPLFYSGDLTKLDAYTLSILCNTEAIEVNQDPLGECARVVGVPGKTFVLVKNMEDGSKAVGLCNRDTTSQSVGVTWAELGLNGPHRVRDLWRQKDLGSFTERFETTVPARGVALVRLWKE